MKKIIIILGTIILGVYIVSTLILGNLKTSATSITTTGEKEITTMINNRNN